MGNQTLCEVPSRYQSIANAFCLAQGRENCPKVPCTLVYLSDKFTTNVECLRGGKVAVGIKPDQVCRKSPALELFSNPRRKPSIRAEAYTKLTTELYAQALGPYRDEEQSKWGISLEGESIGYYPTAADQRRLMTLFDITVGYDRRLFDLITDVHLSAYVDRIINKSSQRLTLHQLMQDKVVGSSNIFFSSEATIFLQSEELLLREFSG